MLKNLMKTAVTSALSFMMLSSYWEFPFSGPSAFFFGEPEFPYENR